VQRNANEIERCLVEGEQHDVGFCKQAKSAAWTVASMGEKVEAIQSEPDTRLYEEFCFGRMFTVAINCSLGPLVVALLA